MAKLNTYFMNFIELTLLSGVKHYYNIDQIISFGVIGDHTNIFTTNGECDRVFETPFQIVEKTKEIYTITKSI